MFLSSSIFKLLVGCFILWAGLFYFTIESTVAIWYRSETFAHCFIILPICIYLIKQKWRQLTEVDVSPNYKVLVLIVGVLAVWLFGSLSQLLVIEQGAGFLMLPLIIWLVCGNKVARILAFTMAFWMFSVPVGEFLIPQLQELTADITVWSLQMTGIPVFREGLYIAIPGGLFEVAVACSGIRYLIASFTLGTLFAYLNYNSTKKRAIFVLFSILLPLLANGIRAYGIVMIAHLSDMKYATGVDHLIYGWLFFGVVILIMFSVGNIWADPLESESTDKQLAKNNFPLSKAYPSFVIVGVTILLGMGYKSLMQDPKALGNFDSAQLFSTHRAIKDETWLPDFKNATAISTGSDKGIDYFLAYYAANVQDSELINSVNELYRTEKWSIVSSQNFATYRQLEINNAAGQKRLISFAYVTDWLVSPSAIKIKLSQAVQAFLGQPQAGMVFVMSVPLDAGRSKEKLLQKKASEKFTDALREHINNG